MSGWLRWMGIGALVVGAFLIGGAIASGEAELALAVIFPVIYGGGPLLAAGIAALLAGFVLWFLGLAGGPAALPAVPAELPERPTVPAEARRRFGGVVFIGPVPIAFGSDQRAAFWALVGGAILVALLLALVLGGLLI